MQKKWRLAIVGATGVVGQEIARVLESRNFPVDTLVPLASKRSQGTHISFGGRSISVQEARAEAFDGIDLVLMSAGSALSLALAPEAIKRGAWVVDNSAAWRQNDDTPLIVPEVNRATLSTKLQHALADAHIKPFIVANPNCSTIQSVVALMPLHERATLKRLVISTYQAVSGAGKDGMDELSEQVMALYGQKSFVPKTFKKQIAFNCLPHIDTFLADGTTVEEQKMRDETRKIMGIPKLDVVATCVRVPVFNGHGVSIVAEFATPISQAEAQALWAKAPGVTLVDQPNNSVYPTSIDAEGRDDVLVGRARQADRPTALAFYCVADNVRKGAAVNAVQIAEVLWQTMQGLGA